MASAAIAGCTVVRWRLQRLLQLWQWSLFVVVTRFLTASSVGPKVPVVPDSSGSCCVAVNDDHGDDDSGDSDDFADVDAAAAATSDATSS